MSIAFCYACAEATHDQGLGGDMLVTGGAGGDAGSGGSSSPQPGGAGSGGDATLPVSGSGGSDSFGGSAGAGAGAGGNGGLGGVAGASGGAAGSAGMAGVAGMAGSAGAPAEVGHRWARLVATSEQAGAVWSSVAELQIFTTADVPIARSNWVVTADSQELDDEPAPATAAIDGDTATFWHTSWEPQGVGDSALPHSLVVNLGANYTITGFSYLPRQNSSNGRISGWEFYVSKDGAAWGTAVKTGSFAAGTAVQKIVF